jgi:hypothetical protein
MRSRLDWFACAVLIGALAGCGSSKSRDSSTSSDAAVRGEDSDNDAGPSDSNGSTRTDSSTKSDAGSQSSGAKSDAGRGSSSGGKGGSTSAANGGNGGNGGNASDLPSDGNQLSLCSKAQGDCNKGLACSLSANALAESRNYCSKICETDDDCAGVTPSSAKYTCSTGGGTKMCQIACTGSDDKSCPESMLCMQTGVTVERAATGGSGGAAEPRAGAGGANGGNGNGNANGNGRSVVAVYHCNYPLITSPIWGPCQDGQHQCDKDAVCYGGAADRAGVCTKNCTMDGDCSEKPSSGSITPSCATIRPARGNMMESKLCVLSCLDMKDGCPDGTTCVDGPRTSMGPGNMTMGRGRGRGMADAGSDSGSEPSYARCE